MSARPQGTQLSYSLQLWFKAPLNYHEACTGLLGHTANRHESVA